MADTDNPRNLIVDSDVATRKGVFSNLVVAYNGRNGMTQLNFLYVDPAMDENDAGAETAILEARVHMNERDVVALRDLLIQITSEAESPKRGDDGE